MSAGPQGTKVPMDNGDVNDALQVVVEDSKPENFEDDVKDAKEDVKDAKDDVKDDVMEAKDDVKKGKDDVKDAKEDEKAAKCDKKRKKGMGSGAVEKRGKKTKRAWLIDIDCASKKDIKCIDLSMSDTFGELTKKYFAPKTTMQTVVLDYKQNGQKKKNLTFCFDEESTYICKKNMVIAGISREIWPDPGRNRFSHGAFGCYVLYFSGSVSGAPSSDMPPVSAIDDVIERLCECNE
jgi:hypothetical protein